MNEEMRYVAEAIRKITDRNIRKRLGISYDEFESLDFDEQQRLVMRYRNRKRKKFNSELVRVMIGSDEDTSFVYKKCGARYLLFDGSFAKAGSTPEQSRNRIEDRVDEVVYGKPLALVMKLRRRIRNR